MDKTDVKSSIEGESLLFERSEFQAFLDFCLLFINGKVEARPA
ncbi:MAG: hypothetical protein AAF944_07605 [Bacteroidota bacterium]